MPPSKYVSVHLLKMCSQNDHPYHMLTLFLLAVTCRLLMIFANSLDPDQDQHSVSSDLVLNDLTL